MTHRGRRGEGAESDQPQVHVMLSVIPGFPLNTDQGLEVPIYRTVGEAIRANRLAKRAAGGAVKTHQVVAT